MMPCPRRHRPVKRRGRSSTMRLVQKPLLLLLFVLLMVAHNSEGARLGNHHFPTTITPRQLLEQIHVASEHINPEPKARLDCDPCIDRPTYIIKAITHGNRDGGLFWHQVKAAAESAASLLRIQLEFELYDNYDPFVMANDILSSVNAWNPPDALIVTIPSPQVHNAIRLAVARGIPVFGINSGREMAEELGLSGFLAMDEYEGGVQAAKQALKAKTEAHSINSWDDRSFKLERALFINHEQGNIALDLRFQGFRNTLLADHQQLQLELQKETEETPMMMDSNSTLVNITITGSTTKTNQAETLLQVDQFFLNQTKKWHDRFNDLEGLLAGCPYDVILLAGQSILQPTLMALYTNECILSARTTLVGTFDASSAVHDAIAVGKLNFAVSQQQHLQGMLSVVFAATYSTTKKRLLYTNTSAIPFFSTGPKIITLQDLPPDTLQVCEEEAFPICPNTLNPYGVKESRCACTDLSKFTIAAVFHGMENSHFWSGVAAQSHAAATDLGINLELHLQEVVDDEEVLFAKMSNKIISLCRDGVDGIVVSIPTEAVVPAIKECMELNVPIMSVNTGAEIAHDIGMMHHIGQIEYDAGYEAGVRMIDLGMKQAMCPHDAGNTGLNMRCSGFRDAIQNAADSGVVFLGMPELAVNGYDYELVFIKAIENEMARLNATWDGLGLLVGSHTYAGHSLVLKARYPNILIGTFDKDQTVLDSIESGDVAFGIDQGDFLQGYLPIWLLSIKAYTEQFLQDEYLASGPTFIDEPQPENAIQCESDHFKVCEPAIEYTYTYNRITSFRPVGLTLAAIILVTSFFFAGWTIAFRKAPAVAVAQPTFLVLLTVGTTVMAGTIIPLSIDDGIASDEACSKACQAVPWLFTLGFTITFSVLYIKVWRVNWVMREARRFRRVKVSAWHVMLPLVVLVALNVALMLAWTLVDPMYWDRVHEGELDSYGICRLGQTSTSAYLFGAVVVTNFCALLLLIVEAWGTRDVSQSLSETKYIFYILGCMLQSGFVGVPLIALVSNSPVATYFLKTALVFVLCMSTLLLIFVPKLKNWRLGVISIGSLTGSRHTNYDASRVSVASASRDPASRAFSRMGSSLVDRSEKEQNRSTPFSREEKAGVAAKLRTLEKLLQDRGIEAISLFQDAGLGVYLTDEEPQCKRARSVRFSDDPNAEEETATVAADTKTASAVEPEELHVSFHFDG